MFLITGFGRGSSGVERSTSFIIEIFHSISENGLQVRVIEKYDPDYLFYERRMAVNDPESQRSTYEKDIPEPDQYTKAEETKWSKIKGKQVKGGAILGHPQCGGRVPGQCSIIGIEVAKKVCESWNKCEGFKCGTWNAKYNDCQLFGKGYALQSAEGVYTYDVHIYRVNDVNGCLGVKCGFGKCTDVKSEDGAGFVCEECPFGDQSNEKNTVCSEMNNFQHDDHKNEPGPFSVVRDFLDPNEWHEVTLEVKYKSGCDNDRNQNRGNDELSIWVDGEAAPFNQEFSSVAEVYGCALEFHECTNASVAVLSGNNEDRAVNNVAVGDFDNSKNNDDPNYRTKASLERVNSSGSLDDVYAVEFYSSENFGGSVIKQILADEVVVANGTKKISTQTTAPLSIKVGRQCKVIIYSEDNFRGSTVTIEEGLFESLTQVRNGVLENVDIWSAKIVCWRNMDVPVIGLKFIAMHPYSVRCLLCLFFCFLCQMLCH